MAPSALGLSAASAATGEAPDSPEHAFQVAAEGLAEMFRLSRNSTEMGALGQLLTIDADFVNVLRSSSGRSTRWGSPGF